ncbi:MAG: type II secretion system F family protein [Actinobacteria bacterium]|nr:type II secretion system F family protein [Actinomycetota bacterium]
MILVGISGALLVGGALAALVWALASRPKRVELPEGIGYGAGGSPRFGAVARVAEGALAGGEFGRSLARELPRAGIAYTAPEFVAATACGAAVLGLLFGVAFSPVFGLIVAAAGAAFARLWVRMRAERWRSRFDAQLPEAFDLLAGSLEAGAALPQAMALVADEGDPPVSEEFAQVLAETRLGIPLTEALRASVERVGSRDYAWCVQAVGIQQEFGASLAGVLRTLGEFMRFRQELKREVSALTAEGRVSAYVLIGLPFAVSGFFWLTNPSYLGGLVTTPVGWMMLATAGVLLTIGSLWMLKIVKVEV